MASEIKSKLALYQNNLVELRRKINQIEKGLKRAKLKEMGTIQDQEVRDHIEFDTNFQRELNLLLVEEELKWKQRVKQH